MLLVSLHPLTFTQMAMEWHQYWFWGERAWFWSCWRGRECMHIISLRHPYIAPQVTVMLSSRKHLDSMNHPNQSLHIVIGCASSVLSGMKCLSWGRYLGEPHSKGQLLEWGAKSLKYHIGHPILTNVEQKHSITTLVSNTREWVSMI